MQTKDVCVKRFQNFKEIIFMTSEKDVLLKYDLKAQNIKETGYKICVKIKRIHLN